MSSGFSNNGAVPPTMSGVLPPTGGLKPYTPPTIPMPQQNTPATPSTPVKSTKTTDSQGNTQETTYHKPDTTSGVLNSGSTGTGTSSSSGLGSSSNSTGNQTSTPSAIITPGMINQSNTGTISQQQALAAQQQYAIDHPTTNPVDPNSYQGLINTAQTAAQKAQSFQQGLTTQENQEQYNPNNTGNVGTLGAGLLQATQGAQATALSNIAATDASLANTAAGLQYGTPATSGVGGASLNPLNNISSIAQQVISGQISPSQGYSMGGNVQNFQGALNAAIQQASPGFNTGTAQGKFDAQQSNVQTQGSANTNAANTGYSGAVQEYQNNTASYTALTGISNQVTSTLSNYANSGALTDVNAAINTLQGKLSNPDYQKFITAIGNAQASYQAILGSSGVTPTKADQDAVAALNPNSSASTIVAALNQLSSDAHALIIAPSYQKVQNYKSQLGI